MDPIFIFFFVILETSPESWIRFNEFFFPPPTFTSLLLIFLNFRIWVKINSHKSSTCRTSLTCLPVPPNPI